MNPAPSPTDSPRSRYGIPIPRSLPRILGWIIVVLITLHVVLHTLYYNGIDPGFDIRLTFAVDEEPSVPTWFNCMELSIAAVLLLAIARDKRRANDRFMRHWYGLALGFGLMSLDEIACIHQSFNNYTDIDWTIPGAILVAILALVYVRFVIHLPARSRWGFLAAGAVYIGGVLGVEAYIGNPFLFHYSIISLQYELVTGLEEGMEMTGAAMFIAALIRYMSEQQKSAPPVTVGLEVPSGNS